MILKKIAVGPLEVNCFLVASESTRECAIIDPGDEGEKIISEIEKENLMPMYILLTHGHFDHLSAANYLKKHFDIPIMLHEADKMLAENASAQAIMFGMADPGNVTPDEFLDEKTDLSVGDLKIKILHTPGHSPGNVTFQIENDLFVGDLIFQGSIGRTDLPGGSYQELIQSVENKIFIFPNEFKIHPGHGPDTTVGLEKQNNPFFS